MGTGIAMGRSGSLVAASCMLLLSQASGASAASRASSRGGAAAQAAMQAQAAASATAGDFSFSIEPRQGPSTGGTLVTFSISGGVFASDTFQCQFGERVVPAQSFFLSPARAGGIGASAGDAQSSGGQPSVLCAAPAGPMRTSVTTRLSLDGRRFASGPRFYYHDASATTNNNNNNQ